MAPRRFARLAALLVVLLLPACGGGDDTDDEAGGPSSGPSESSTTEVEGDADEASDETTTVPAAVRTSRALALVPEDLGPEWKVQTAAVGPDPAEPDSCARTAERGLTGLVEEGRYEGAILQRGTPAFFVSSVTFAFVDEAAAVAEIARRKQESFRECRRSELDEFAAVPGGPEGASWRIANVGDSEGTGERGFELQVDYQFQAVSDGKLQDANGVYQLVIYRVGASVAEYTLQAVSAASDPPDLWDVGFEEYRASAAKAQARAAKI